METKSIQLGNECIPTEMISKNLVCFPPFLFDLKNLEERTVREQEQDFTGVGHYSDQLHKKRISEQPITILASRRESPLSNYKSSWKKW